MTTNNAPRRAASASVPIETRSERYATMTGAIAPYADLGVDRDVARIAYNACKAREDFSRFLDAVFSASATQKARGLVVDIRNNSGGDSSVNEELFRYVTTKPYRQFGGVRVRISDRLRREYGKEKYSKIYGTGAWSGPDGDLVTYSAPAPAPPRSPSAKRFSGPAYLLIGPATFSSAMACASATKAFDLMTVVGEETGEPVLSTGEVYAFLLPRTGYTGYVTTKVFLPPAPLPPDRGVIPDIPAPLTRAERIAGLDPALEAVLRTVAH